MTRKIFCFAAAAAMLLVLSSCSKAEPYKQFSDLCTAKLSDAKYPSVAELEAVSKDISTWEPSIQKRGLDVIAKAKAYEKASGSDSLSESMSAMAEYGKALGDFIEAAK